MCLVAILIPTLNRSEFLIRQLQYYASVKSKHPVYIGDGSGPEHQKDMELAVRKFQDQLTIHYYHWPDLNDQQTIKKLGLVAQEKYCAFVGDDDFLVPDSLTLCARFLEQNLEYRTAQGKGVIFSLDGSGPCNTFKSLGTYWAHKEALETTGIERILQFGSNYWVPQFSVHRQEEFVEDSKDYGTLSDRSFGELLHSFTFITKGKSKFIDCLYLIRQVHDARYHLPDIFDWLTNPHWLPSFERFSKSLSEILASVDDIEISEAQDVVKQAFWAYLARGLTNKYNVNKFGADEIPRSSVKDWLKDIPSVLLLAQKGRVLTSVFSSRKGEISLQALRRPTSPYHRDFMPVYHVITSKG